MTAEALTALAERVAQLEEERDALAELLRSLVGAVGQLAQLTGTHDVVVAEPKPARPALRVIEGGARR